MIKVVTLIHCKINFKRAFVVYLYYWETADYEQKLITKHRKITKLTNSGYHIFLPKILAECPNFIFKLVTYYCKNDTEDFTLYNVCSAYK